MVECLVEYEYVAQEEDELNIRPGDIVTNVQKQDGGWWEGEINGKKGVFPDNFVKEIKQEVKKVAPESNHRASVKKVGPGGGGHVAELANRLGKEGAIRIGPPAQGGIKREISLGKRQQRVKVTFSYSPENDDELGLEVGDIVTVTKQEEEGWWEGILNGKQGVFPSNFVEPIEEDGAGAENTSGDELNTPEVEIHGKKVKGVGLGNIFSAGPIKLRSTSKDNPAAVKRTPTSPKSNIPKESTPLENEKRDSIKRTTAPAEPVPSLPPKDQPTLKPLLNNYGYAVQYTELDEEPDTSESSNRGGYSPGGIVIEDGVVNEKKCTSSPSDFSLPQLAVASPESSCSLELGQEAVLSSSSLQSSGPCSSRSERQSDDVPFELGALSQTRHTPPPSFSQFNFRKRRSRGTPKNSPKVGVVLINQLKENSQQNEKPPKKVAKLVGTSVPVEDQAVMTEEWPVTDTTTTESQTVAQYVEDTNLTEVTPQDVVIKAFVRSKSEPCLMTTKRNVSFVTRDNYISDGEDNTDTIQISEQAKKRMARAKRRFPSRGMIDGSKITDSLRLLRLRRGMDPENPQTEGDEPSVEFSKQVDMKSKSSTLSSIKKKFIRKISSSPIRGSKVKGLQENQHVTALSSINIGDTGISATEDNCSTTALRGSPLSTRSSSVIDTDETNNKPVALHLRQKTDEVLTSSMPTLIRESAETSPPVYKKPFFTFSLGRKKGQKVKLLEPKSPVPSPAPEQIPDPEKETHETSYFQTLDNLGKMSPAIRNIGTKYKLFSMKHTEVLPEVSGENEDGSCENIPLSRKDSDLFLKPFQNVLKEEEAAGDEAVPPERENSEEKSDLQMATPYQEIESNPISQPGNIYAPNEGDQNRPLVKRTKKSTYIALDPDVMAEVRKPNEKRPTPQKKDRIKKSNSITQRLRRILSSREKVEKYKDDNPGDETIGPEVVDRSQERREKLATSSDTVTIKSFANQEPVVQNQSLMTQSEGALIYVESAESSPSDDENLDSPKNVNQNCDNYPMDAIFRLQNFVHSFTQSETDVLQEATDCAYTIGNSVPQMNQVEVFGTSCEPNTVKEPCLDSEDANLEYPSPFGKRQKDQTDIQAVDLGVRRRQGIEPRRIVPTRIEEQPESMQTEEEKGKETNSEGTTVDKPDISLVMHCQLEEPREIRFRQYNGFLHSICMSEKERSKDLDHIFVEGDFMSDTRKMDPMRMDTYEYLENRKNGDPMNAEKSAKNVKWHRNNSAPPGSLDRLAPKLNGLTRNNISFDETHDGSLDKWDLMKVMLEETEKFFKPSLGTITEKKIHRPLDYDESFSTGSSCSTDSAEEAVGMETGDCEPEIDAPSDSGFNRSINPVVLSIYASDDDLYGSAPISSPCQEQIISDHTISVSSLNDSLSQLETCRDRGGSGEKRKKCEVGTPTKDETVGRKVRVESPESGDEGPPRAKRVLRADKPEDKV